MPRYNQTFKPLFPLEPVLLAPVTQQPLHLANIARQPVLLASLSHRALPSFRTFKAKE